MASVLNCTQLWLRLGNVSVARNFPPLVAVSRWSTQCWVRRRYCRICSRNFCSGEGRRGRNAGSKDMVAVAVVRRCGGAK
jgi:hypothetical protein